MKRIIPQSFFESFTNYSFILQFDIPFDSVNGRINFVEKASLGFLVTMRNFKKACCIAGLTDSQKASTEQCITSLRNQVKNETREDCLQVSYLCGLSAEGSVFEAQRPNTKPSSLFRLCLSSAIHCFDYQHQF